jgi:hypothetical protein
MNEKFDHPPTPSFLDSLLKFDHLFSTQVIYVDLYSIFFHGIPQQQQGFRKVTLLYIERCLSMAKGLPPNTTITIFRRSNSTQIYIGSRESQSPAGYLFHFLEKLEGEE